MDAALAAARVTQDQYNRTLSQLDPAARAAREAAAKAEQEAQQFAERSRNALASIGENALDRIGNGLVNAFAAGKQAAIDFGSIARQVIASVVTDMAKLAIVNPLVNAVFGASRPSLMGAFGGAAPTGGTTSTTSAPGSAGMFSFSPLPFLNMGAPNLFGSTGGLGGGGLSFSDRSTSRSSAKRADPSTAPSAEGFGLEAQSQRLGMAAQPAAQQQEQQPQRQRPRQPPQ